MTLKAIDETPTNSLIINPLLTLLYISEFDKYPLNLPFKNRFTKSLTYIRIWRNKKGIGRT